MISNYLCVIIERNYNMKIWFIIAVAHTPQASVKYKPEK